MNELTTQNIIECAEMLEANNIPPLVVQTHCQAQAMTSSDPSAYVWQKGDEYYFLHTLLKH